MTKVLYLVRKYTKFRWDLSQPEEFVHQFNAVVEGIFGGAEETPCHSSDQVMLQLCTFTRFLSKYFIDYFCNFVKTKNNLCNFTNYLFWYLYFVSVYELPISIIGDTFVIQRVCRTDWFAIIPLFRWKS